MKKLDQSVFVGQDPEWRYAAVDRSGIAFLYSVRPYTNGSAWCVALSGEPVCTQIEGRYNPACWADSLIQRAADIADPFDGAAAVWQFAAMDCNGVSRLYKRRPDMDFTRGVWCSTDDEPGLLIPFKWTNPFGWQSLIGRECPSVADDWKSIPFSTKSEAIHAESSGPRFPIGTPVEFNYSDAFWKTATVVGHHGDKNIIVMDKVYAGVPSDKLRNQRSECEVFHDKVCELLGWKPTDAEAEKMCREETGKLFKAGCRL